MKVGTATPGKMADLGNNVNRPEFNALQRLEPTRAQVSLAESAIKQVISRRMVKKQQMAWSPDAAHNLLQVRTAVLNNDLKASFD